MPNIGMPIFGSKPIIPQVSWITFGVLEALSGAVAARLAAANANSEAMFNFSAKKKPKQVRPKSMGKKEKKEGGSESYEHVLYGGMYASSKRVCMGRVETVTDEDGVTTHVIKETEGKEEEYVQQRRESVGDDGASAASEEEVLQAVNTGTIPNGWNDTKIVMIPKTGSPEKEIMLKLGFKEKWVDLVMQCVSSVEYRICFNNEETESFKPSREGLTALLANAEENGNISGVKGVRPARLVRLRGSDRSGSGSRRAVRFYFPRLVSGDPPLAIARSVSSLRSSVISDSNRIELSVYRPYGLLPLCSPIKRSRHQLIRLRGGFQGLVDSCCAADLAVGVCALILDATKWASASCGEMILDIDQGWRIFASALHVLADLFWPKTMLLEVWPYMQTCCSCVGFHGLAAGLDLVCGDPWGVVCQGDLSQMQQKQEGSGSAEMWRFGFLHMAIFYNTDSYAKVHESKDNPKLSTNGASYNRERLLPRFLLLPFLWMQIFFSPEHVGNDAESVLIFCLDGKQPKILGALHNRKLSYAELSPEETTVVLAAFACSIDQAMLYILELVGVPCRVRYKTAEIVLKGKGLGDSWMFFSSSDYILSLGLELLVMPAWLRIHKCLEA
ncbi:hypothetical protein TRIUR3_26756 [Triticum urartu]|uniref:Uncharacterized protein n=1 Tax=Triticum urartu TaxID=4572 RepID=M8B259_TRIUA|nr:hypothetical protein TRIUR3_26756 [Triticum urartu]